MRQLKSFRQPYYCASCAAVSHNIARQQLATLHHHGVLLLLIPAGCIHGCTQAGQQAEESDDDGQDAALPWGRAADQAPSPAAAAAETAAIKQVLVSTVSTRARSLAAAGMESLPGCQSQVQTMRNAPLFNQQAALLAVC
jgi:hypothetical protein